MTSFLWIDLDFLVIQSLEKRKGWLLWRVFSNNRELKTLVLVVLVEILLKSLIRSSPIVRAGP